MSNYSSRTNLPITLKLDSQKIVEFTGKPEDWQKWKTRMQCTFDGLGYERILSNPDYAMQHPGMSRIVYLQLSVATSGRTAYHLVKQYKKEKEGNKAWGALLEWYAGDVMRLETAEAIQSWLEGYRLGNT
eukprot:5430982-Ditylum_brightwellii.AAC.1